MRKNTVNRRNERLKRFFAVFLSASILLTMDVSALAGEEVLDDPGDTEYITDFVGEEDEADIDSYEVDGFDVDPDSEDVYEIMKDKDENNGSAAGEFLSKWSFTISDQSIGKMSFSQYAKERNDAGERFKGELIIEHEEGDSNNRQTDFNGKYIYHKVEKKSFGGMIETYHFYFAKGIDLSVNGVIGAGNAFDTDSNGYYYNRTRTMVIGTPYYITDTSNKESKGVIFRKDENNVLNINIDNIPEGERLSGEGQNEYVLNIWVDLAGLYNAGFEKDMIHLNLADGLYLKEEKEEKGYLKYVISNTDDDPDMGANEIFGEKLVTVGDYQVSYNSFMPYQGKNTKKYKFGGITISYNGKKYEVEKVKIIRLKGAPADQGPFPTVSNAAIQIMKLKTKNKKIQKYLKKATKVNKSASWDKQQLPIVIYPRRITEATQNRKKEGKNKSNASTIVLKIKKNGKMVLSLNPGNGKTEKIKDGKKDSFKTGTQHLSYDSDKKIITVSSADLWTGSNGLSTSANKVTLKRK